MRRDGERAAGPCFRPSTAGHAARVTDGEFRVLLVVRCAARVMHLTD
jgi:hypothetical protein